MKPKYQRIIEALQLVGDRIASANFRHDSGQAMFKTEPISEADQIRLRELGFDAGERSFAIGDQGPWK